MVTAAPIHVERVRQHFFFPASRQAVTNNAASTQPPRELVDLFKTLAPDYENVHRGQCEKSTGTVMCSSRWRVTPPSIHSRRREWP